MPANSLFTKYNFVLLTVLDGWGIAPPSDANAITQAKLPNYNKFWNSYPHTYLGASGESVGLPRGEVGNTETGHLNLGAGRIVYQDLVRINMSIADGSFFQNEVLLNAISHAKAHNSDLHLMGLVGAGGVHSNIEHLYALIQLATRNNFNRVFVHAFTDGRDSPPKSALIYIKQLQEVLQKENSGKIASVMGRYWAMDRDQRWDRTAKAYFALTRGTGVHAESAVSAIEASYSNNINDEFIDPTLIVDENKKPISLIKENDAVIFFNFRIDRPRQLSRAFVLDDLAVTNQEWDFDPYAVKYGKKHDSPQEIPPVVIHRGDKIKNLYFVMMTEYDKFLATGGAHSAYPPEKIQMPLGQVLSMNNRKQLRAAESEKERFVTYYFNGQLENPFPMEERLIVPSPDVETYDLKPEMSASQLTDAVIDRISNSGEDYSFALINFANADMVGHTGNLDATIKGVETVDQCLGRLASFVDSKGGVMLITADHGNAEEMKNKEGGIDTEHSDAQVPFIAVSEKLIQYPKTLRSGILGDVAPTILKILQLEVPPQMNGRNLLEELV